MEHILTFNTFMEFVEAVQQAIAAAGYRWPIFNEPILTRSFFAGISVEETARYVIEHYIEL